MKLIACFLLSALVARAEIFSIAQVGDIHAEVSTSQTYGTNYVPWILAHTNDGVLNIRIFVSTGDCFEADRAFTVDPTTTTRYTGTQLTNDVRTLCYSGLLTFITDGNHDCDDTNALGGWTAPTVAGKEWNTVFPPAWFSSQPFYVTSRFAGDNKNMVMAYTNGVTRLLFISYHSDPDTNNPTATYLPQSQWISNTVSQYPNHNVILCAHYFLSTNGTPAPDDGVGYFNIGPGKAVVDNEMLKCPNLCLGISGHTRSAWKGSYLTNTAGGSPMRFLNFNTQTVSGRASDYVNLLTFDTAASTVRTRTWCLSEARYLTNYDRSFVNTFFPNGFLHEWTMTLPVRPPVTLYLTR